MRWLVPLLCLLSPVSGQDVISSVRIQASPTGAPFYVDGTRYTSAITLLWTRGSKHVLAAEPPSTELKFPIEYVFQSWADSTGLWSTASREITVTAHPAITQFTASYSQLNLVNVLIEEPGSGRVELGNASYSQTSAAYVASGSDMTLRAFPAPEWMFDGWFAEYLPFGRGPSAQFLSLKISAPMTIRPRFSRARRASLRTVPAGLNIYVDRTLTPTPAEQEWAFLSNYRLSAPSPQADANGKWWIFDKWNFADGQNSTYKVHDAGPFTITGTFKRGVPATFETSPGRLRLNIDGRENWPVYSFIWPEGGMKTVTAPAEQIDSAGRRWVFKNWSNGGAASQIITVASDIRWKATYEPMPRLTVESSPPGLPVEVDGVTCSTPCRLDRSAGASVSVQPRATVPFAIGSRYELTTPAGEAITLNADRTVVLIYLRSHQLETVVDPADGGSIDGASGGDGYMSEGVEVQLSAKPNPGYKLRSWSGENSFTMTGPRSVGAVFEPAPWSAGMRNAAGPENVAPGSRASITGLNLADSTIATSTQSPVPQTLGGVVVTWRDRMLPLLLVSPEEIQVLLPWDLPEGSETFSVKREGHPDVKATGNVMPIAPGLFENMIRHDDGSVTLLATGIGSYDRPPLEGFPALGAAHALERVEVLVGEDVVAPISVAASTTQAGIASVRVRLPEERTEIRLRVAGRVSNPITKQPQSGR